MTIFFGEGCLRVAIGYGKNTHTESEYSVSNSSPKFESSQVRKHPSLGLFVWKISFLGKLFLWKISFFDELFVWIIFFS